MTDEDRLKIAYKLFDANGTEVEHGECSPEDAAEIIAQFVVTHGSDPDCDGKAADSGTITFAPTRRVDYWENDPNFPVSDWQEEVACGDTRQSYHDWRVCARMTEEPSDGE